MLSGEMSYQSNYSLTSSDKARILYLFGIELEDVQYAIVVYVTDDDKSCTYVRTIQLRMNNNICIYIYLVTW